MRHADHLNPTTYGGFYQSTISTVDGQASIFGLPKQGSEIHELFRGFSLHRNYQYNPKLSQTEQSEPNTAVVPSADRQQDYEWKRQQKDRLLKELRLAFCDSWTSVQQEYESDFQQNRRLMPQRDRLATTLFQTGSLRESDGLLVVKDLVALFPACNNDSCIRDKLSGLER